MPSYSSELNRNEMGNADLKEAAITKLASPLTKLQRVKATAKHLGSVQTAQSDPKLPLSLRPSVMLLEFNAVMPIQ